MTVTSSRKYSTIVLDVGGVLLFNPSIGSVPVSPRLILNALDSPVWHELERDNISETDCNVAVCQTFGCDLELWIETLSMMRGSLRPNTEFIQTIRCLKEINPRLRVLGLSNMPSWDYEQLKPTLDEWGIFDGFFTSAQLRERKPDEIMYKKFQEEAGVDAESCVFVDDRLENVVAAHSIGFQGIVFDDTESATLQLQALFPDPVLRGRSFLLANAKKLFCELNTGGHQPDNYSQLLILEHTTDRELVTIERKGPTMNYFIGEPTFAETTYPNDSDTTSLAMVVLDDVTPAEKDIVMQTILQHLNPDGMPYCWFDHNRPRFCHCICANVFRFFYLNDQASKLPGVYEYLCRLLRSGAFLFGTRYYTTPDWLFYYLGDVCGKRPDDQGLSEMRELLIARIKERTGLDETDILACALRLLASQALGIQNSRDLEAVTKAQQDDGGWERVWLWRYGKEKIKLGSRGVITAMAVRAIENARKERSSGVDRTNGHVNGNGETS